MKVKEKLKMSCAYNITKQNQQINFNFKKHVKNKIKLKENEKLNECSVE